MPSAPRSEQELEAVGAGHAGIVRGAEPAVEENPGRLSPSAAAPRGGAALPSLRGKKKTGRPEKG